MKLKIAVLLVAAAAWIVLPASAQLINLYQDPLASTCNLEVPFPGPPVDVYVVFMSGGGVDGIAGASLRIDGLPSGWLAAVDPNPSASRAYGDLLGLGGEIAFEECQPGPVVLWRITLTPTTAVSNHQVFVRYNLHQPVDIGSGFVCPSYFPCSPATPQQALPDAVARLNSPVACEGRLPGRCPQAADVPPNPPTEWGMVKSIYRLAKRQ